MASLAQVATEKKRLSVVEMNRFLREPFPSGDKRDALCKAIVGRMRKTQSWRSDTSMFSALNIETSVRRPGDSPLARVTGPMPVAVASSAGVCHIASSTSTLKVVPEGKPLGAQASEKAAAPEICQEIPLRLRSQSSVETSLPDSDDGAFSDSGGTQSVENDGVAEDPVQEESHPAEQPAASFNQMRSFLLSFRGSSAESAPPELTSLCARAPEERGGGSSRRSPTGTLPTPRARTLSSLSKQEELKRSVKSMLNKVCPENVATIAGKIAAVEVQDAEQLETIIELIFKKALAEPHYCETYADLVFSLKSTFPEFPSKDGGKPTSFKSSVLNICQNEFEETLVGHEAADEEQAELCPEELGLQRKAKKDRMRANMKFIGHLFLRQLLSTKVIGSVICELLLCDQTDEMPEEHAIESACELLMSVGYTLETIPSGVRAVEQVCGRMLELKSRKSPEGKGIYCKRVQFMVQDLLETRHAGWTKKTFQCTAKTKEEIRQEQERDIIAKAQGVQSPSGERLVAGQRPGYLSLSSA
mmetsp:Transcript_51210/g.112212  ORF Transcript_51210/g.112212 Transcript_51210/m.112212 type:complete len:531 (+) Transcript_51210:138-1730(+)